MKKMNKLLALFMAVVMSFSLAIPAFAEETKPEATTTEETKPEAEAPAEGKEPADKQEAPAVPFNGEIVILHTNDVHGGIKGYATVKALKDKYQAEGAYVLYMDAGDFAQGDPTVNVSKGATAVELMNMAGVDVCSLGNHEFDYGYENAKELEKAAKFPILAANVMYNGKLAFGDKTTFTAPDGTKIGVFGLDTPETATKAHPGKIKGVTFLSEENDAIFKCAQEQVDALKADNCDIIVCVAHMGTDTESMGHRSIDLLEKVTGIDVLIDGHSHSTLEEVKAATEGTGIVKGAYLTSTGTKLENIGKVVIKDKKVVSVEELVTKEQTVAPDAAVKARADEIQKQIDDEYGTVFAKTEVDLNGEKKFVRSQESNMGDLICDALLWGAEKNGIKADAALTNGGGIRAAIKAGDITKKDINTVLPFGNELSVIKVTGAELLEALEAASFVAPEALGGFAQVSGIEYTINTMKAFDAGDLYPGSTYHKPASIQRVSIQTVGGKAFDPKATYSIVTNDFVANGGDVYYVFKAAASNTNLGIPMDEIVMNYITEELKGVVTAEKYGKTDGRITMKGFSDVTAKNWYFGAVSFVDEKGLMDGKDGMFMPGSDMTREMLVTALYRLAGSPEIKDVENTFSDVAADAPYLNAVLWASQKEIVKGFEDGTFKPDASITREQMAAILYRYAEAKTAEADFSVFTDGADVHEYAKEAMSWAIAKGLMKGNADNTLAPRGTATRAQVATILQRFAELPAEKPAETPAEKAA